MSNNVNDYKILLSALSDGELSKEEANHLFDALRQDKPDASELRKYWQQLQGGKFLMAGQGGSVIEHFDLSFADKVSSAITQEQQEENPEAEVTGSMLGADVISINSRTSRFGFSAMQNFAIAASVMVAVLFSWYGSQSPLKDELLAKFSGDKETTQLAKGFEQEGSTEIASDAFAQRNFVNVSAGNISGESNREGVKREGAQKESFHLAGDRIEQYMILHAEHSALNSNQGIMPFARVNQVPRTEQF
jgi:negative regulator of sigma E activity